MTDGSKTRAGLTPWLLLAMVLVVAAPAQAHPTATASRTGVYRLAILKLNYSDASTHRFTDAQLRQAAGEIHDFFGELSYGALDMQVSVHTADLTRSRNHYWAACAPAGETRVPCPPPLAEDAVETAVRGGADLTAVHGLVLLSPWGGGDVTIGDVEVNRAGLVRRFHRSYDFEGALAAGLNAPGPSGVAWNAWAHEIGHQLQIDDRTTLGGIWNGHPSAYASGYDLMDSCYPCHETVYGLSTAPVMNGVKRVFPGFLPADRVVEVSAPAAGTETGQTVVLAPLSEGLNASPAAKGIKIPIGTGRYYLVEARRRIGSDARNVGPGIYDEGVLIQRVDEAADPPVTNMDSCDTLVAGGCVRSRSDSRWASCNVTGARRYPDLPDYCWPYPLWHAGNRFADTGNRVQIRVDGPTGNGFSVTVTRAEPRRRPDVLVTPWRTPPMNTWETTDLWVDSSCNGYESDVGASGLRYGRRADGTVIGSGDDPCANHPNRLFAHVTNAGDAPARNVVVDLRVSDPPGVGIRDARGWTLVGTATATQFPALRTLAPGESVDVWVPWTPRVTGGRAPRFAFHSCFKVIVHRVEGEVVTSNQDGDGEQENVGTFEAVQAGQIIRDAIGSIFVRNVLPRSLASTTRTFTIRTDSVVLTAGKILPPPVSVGPGTDLGQLDAVELTKRRSLTLEPKRTGHIPFRVHVPKGAGPGDMVLAEFEAGTVGLLTNPAIPKTSPVPRTHRTSVVPAGVTALVPVVEPTSVSASSRRKRSRLIVRGRVSPVPADGNVAIDLLDRRGARKRTLVAAIRADGRFAASVRGAGAVRATRVIWQGDRRRAAAVSKAERVR